MANPEYPWTYFVSYAHGRGFGSMTLFRRDPINSEAANTELREAVVEVNPVFSPNEVVVLNFRLLAWPESCPSCGRAS